MFSEAGIEVITENEFDIDAVINLVDEAMINAENGSNHCIILL